MRRGINDRETLISGPSGDFCVGCRERGGALHTIERRVVVKKCCWTRIDTRSFIKVGHRESAGRKWMASKVGLF